MVNLSEGAQTNQWSKEMSIFEKVKEEQKRAVRPPAQTDGDLSSTNGVFVA